VGVSSELCGLIFGLIGFDHVRYQYGGDAAGAECFEYCGKEDVKG